MMRKVYFDHSATTPVRPEVVAAMLPYLTEVYGNASSAHSFGKEAKKAIESARAKVAALINAEPNEIYFTSGGTEADNWAIKGVMEANQKKGRHFVVSNFEHHAIIDSAAHLKKQGYEPEGIAVTPDGLVTVEALSPLLRDDTVLVSVMFANNEVGTIQDVVALAAAAHSRGALFHTDAVQAVGQIPVDVKAMDIDLLSLSGHKLNAPKGIGALFIRKGVAISKIMDGGAHERGKRAGTENVPGIVALGQAAEIAMQELETKIPRLTKLRDRMIEGVLAQVPESSLNGHPTRRLPGNANFCFSRIEGEAILLHMDLNGIAVSTGSACASGSLDPSHVLLALGIPVEEAHGSMRVSMGYGNDDADVDYFLEKLPQVVQRLRDMSPY
jgi:cysteine desulfurase